MAAVKTVAAPSSHSTSMRRAASPSSLSATALAQSARWIETPLPRVTKPMMSSGITGVQHLARRTHTSPRPSTCTPAPPERFWVERRGASAVAETRSAGWEPSVSSPRRRRATRSVTVRADRWRSPTATKSASVSS